MALLNSQVPASFETVARLPSAKSIIVLAWVRARKKADIGDLRHSVSFGIVAEITFAHDSLLASNLGKKTSMNLGAIQI